MKKLLLGSIALTLFSISILLFQISCKKEATAQQPASESTVNQLGQILFTKQFQTSSGTVKKQREIWIANFDGTNSRRIPVNIPIEVKFYEPQLSPNCKTIFFTGEVTIGNEYKTAIYSFLIDGTGFKKVLDFENEYIDDSNYTVTRLASVN